MRYALTGALVLSLASASAAHADEGMWTFDNFPFERMRQTYGFAPDQAWLDRVRSAAVRLTTGCSASVVSPQGLVLTNHHCVVSCVQELSTPQSDLVTAGFLAEDRQRERRCPGMQAEILTGISDVTQEIQGAIGTATGADLTRARNAAIARLESQAGCQGDTVRCQVVTLYGGGQYKLYRYRTYEDVRLTFAPEAALGFFGGDPDNFNFPRYALDAAFLRLYENDRPAATPAHLRWNPRAPVDGEVTFIAGNPGSTQRLLTQSQLAFERDWALPVRQLVRSELRGRLISAMEEDAERARSGRDTLFGIENSFKAQYGQMRALMDPRFMGQLAAAEQELRTRVAADPAVAGRIGDPWAEIEEATAARRNLFLEHDFLEARAGSVSSLFGYARALVRAAAERAKPAGERLREYSDAALPRLERSIREETPVYPWLEELGLEFWLGKTREYLTVDHPAVRRMLGGESPESLAQKLVAGTRLADPAVRAALWEGGQAAIEASDDPLIQFVRATDADARAVRRRFETEVEAPLTAAQSRLAQARFAAYGDTVYPDATFTLRLSYGKVGGWTHNGQNVEPFTRLGGLFDRATGREPFALPERWLAARGRLNPDVVFNFVTNNDIIGGNSGSPLIARDGSVIGAVFDGNIHSLGGAYGFDPAVNRSVIVSSAAVTEALRNVYGADGLLRELGARR